MIECIVIGSEGDAAKQIHKAMGRNDCMSALIAAGMTWAAATCLFHDMLAWRPECQRWVWVEHYVELAREESQLRNE